RPTPPLLSPLSLHDALPISVWCATCAPCSGPCFLRWLPPASSSDTAPAAALLGACRRARRQLSRPGPGRRGQNRARAKNRFFLLRECDFRCANLSQSLFFRSSKKHGLVDGEYEAAWSRDVPPSEGVTAALLFLMKKIAFSVCIYISVVCWVPRAFGKFLTAEAGCELQLGSFSVAD